MFMDELHFAMLNSYEIIVYQVPFSEISIVDKEFFAHDITKPITMEVIDNLIYYFEQIEDYEKCNRLVKMKTYYDGI
mgnify:CR=1 FL=1